MHLSCMQQLLHADAYWQTLLHTHVEGMPTSMGAIHVETDHCTTSSMLWLISMPYPLTSAAATPETR